MMLGKGTIMASSGYLTILLVQSKYPDVDNPFIPAIIVAVFAYLVGSLFLSIFSFSSTAILHCFLLSEELGDKTRAPKYLKDYLSHCDEKRINERADKERIAQEKGMM